MAPVYGFNAEDVKRIGRVVRDNESAPPRLPIADGGHVRTHSRVVVFELISETPDADGLYDVYIMRRKPDGSGYEAISTMKAKLEDLNA